MDSAKLPVEDSVSCRLVSRPSASSGSRCSADLSVALVLLVYFTMPLATCLQAAGKQRVWVVIQMLCVVVSLVVDPLLVPYFQRTRGNGGLGVCVASVVSEVLVITFGAAIAPRGVFDRTLARAVALALVSGAGMAGCAALLRPVSPYLAAPVSALIYALGLRLTGAVEQRQLNAAMAAIRRKLGKFQRAST